MKYYIVAKCLKPILCCAEQTEAHMNQPAENP